MGFLYFWGAGVYSLLLGMDFSFWWPLVAEHRLGSWASVTAVCGSVVEAYGL